MEMSSVNIRGALFGKEPVNPYAFCHRPILVKEPSTLLGKVLSGFRVYPKSDVDDVIDDDLVLI